METEEIKEKIDKLKQGTKATERICHFCGEVIDSKVERGFFKTTVGGSDLVDAHKACYQKDQADKTNIRIRIR